MTPEQEAAIKRARQREALERAQQRMQAEAAAAGAQPAPQTNIVEQVGTGTNEGIASMLGLPVDALTGAINWAGGKMGMAPIENPVGGSGTFRHVLSPFMSDAEPQTGPQRIARRVGQDVGAGAVAAPVAGITSLGALGLNAAADVGSGLAGGVTAEVTDNPVAQVVAALLGGMAPVAASRALRPGPQAPSLDDLRATQSAAYGTVDASPAQLTPQATADLQGNLQGRMTAEGIDPYLHPRANRTLERLGELDHPTIAQIEQRRRLVGRDVAGAMDPSERRLGEIMKDEIDDYLGGLTPAQVRGGNADEAVDALRVGREATQRIKKAEALDEATYRAVNRAATSGTGGNTVNTMRQNVRAILDNPRARRGYSAAEIAAMEDIVRGTPTINALRMLGRLSPTSGALPMMGGIAQAGAWGATGNPLFAVPSIAGLGARHAAEKLTDRQIDALSALLRNGAPLPPKAMSASEEAVVRALLAAQAAPLAARDRTR